MAGLASILSALGRIVWRDLRSLGSITGNNFFLFCALLMLQPQSGVFLDVIVGLLLLFPLTADPLAKLPRERLDSWPISRRERILLRAASVWFSPAVWITVAFLILFRAAFGFAFLLLALVFYALHAAFAALPARRPRWNLLRYVPQPGGAIGGLLRKNLREMLLVLDPYVALVLSLCSLMYRFAAPQPDPDAFMGVTLIIVIALSTYAQCLFALDSDATSFERYRLLPLRGWQILAAKDVPFLAVAVLLTLPLAPLAGLAGALMALAAGHHSSVRRPAPQPRWRFTAGASIGTSIVQIILMGGAVVMTYRNTPMILLPCCAIFAASLWWYGREFERFREGD